MSKVLESFLTYPYGLSSGKVINPGKNDFTEEEFAAAKDLPVLKEFLKNEKFVLEVSKKDK